ncbi:MAG: DUF4867 family protein [Ruminococcaceae bacterium]|nr:DUF4867 family protein [Oscillospiraceae bacterium]
MNVKSVFDTEFKKYGAVLEGYDFGELFEALEKCNTPNAGIEYVACVSVLEQCKVFGELCSRGFGGMPIQLGYCNGVNDTLNCLEYHKSSEFNIAKDDLVLILGLQSDIEKGKYDTSKTEAFHVPAGVGVELYGTTLHYAPCGLKPESAFRMVCVLPKGTNLEKPHIENMDSAEAKMCLGSNKWLLAHPDSDEAKNGAYVGLTGENIVYTV